MRFAPSAVVIGLLVSTPARAVDHRVGTGAWGSVAEAVGAAASGDRVLIDPGTWVLPEITLAPITLEVLAPKGGVTLTPSPNSPAPELFHVGSGASLTLTDLVFDGLGVSRAVAVYGGDLTVRGTTFLDCHASIGGAIKAEDATLVVTTSTFEGSSADTTGGDLSVLRGSARLEDTVHTGSTASDGGVLWASSAGVTWSRGTVDGATAARGAALSVSGGSGVTLDLLEIRNTTATAGATIDLGSATLSLTESTLESNTTTDALIEVDSAEFVRLDATRVQHNNLGGSVLLAISMDDAEITRSLFCENTTGPLGFKFSSASGRFTNNVVLAGHAGQFGLDVFESNLRVENNHFVVNDSQVGAAALASADRGDIVAVNNLVAWTRQPNGAAVEAVGGALAFSYGLLFDNLPAHTSGVTLGAGVLIDVDPGVRPPAPGDCAIASLVPTGPPLVDGGDPSITDADGSVSDIGAFGGPSPNPLAEEPLPTDTGVGPPDTGKPDDTDPPGDTGEPVPPIGGDTGGDPVPTPGPTGSLDGAVGWVCGCASTGGGVAPASLLPLLLIARRRRAPAPRSPRGG